MKKIFFLIILVFIGLSSTACQKKDHQTAILEMDGDISYTLLEDTNRTKKYINTDISVDNNLYNFSIVIPIKSKTNIQELFHSGTLYYFSTDHKRGDSYGYIHSFSSYYQGNDGYYHDSITRRSQDLASEYFLNDIRDIEISYLYEEKNYTDDIKYDTNKLIIPKEQLINLLDSLAIPHDRLEFQTD